MPAQYRLTSLKRSAFFVFVAAPAVTFLPVSAMANELVLEEVVVTAQKQEQTVKDTPVALNAISGETYNEMASFDLTEVDRLTAGVDISGDSFNIDFKIRGVGTNLDSGTPSRVNLFKDGAFINQQRAIFLAQFDLERFELLRGPQGTLYGKPSPAGQLIIHTRDPSLTHRDGYVRVSAFSREGSNTQFGVSQPLIDDKMGLRIAGVFDKNSNSDIHNETLDDDQINRTSAGRATLKWLINENLDTRISYNYTENSGDFYSVTDPNGGFDGEDRKAFGNERGFINIRDQHVIGEVNYSFSDDITVTGVTMYQELFTKRFFDSDRTAASVSTQDVESNIGKVINSELRIHNTSDTDWKWITGIYYQDSRAKTPVEAVTNFTFPAATPGLGGTPGTNTFNIVAYNQTEEIGVFHHSGIQLNERDRLTIGVRYNDSAINALSPFSSVTTAAAFGGVAIDSSSGQAIDPAIEKQEFQEFTGTIKIQRDFDEETTGYLSFDRGWRPASSTVDAAGTVPDELILHDDEPSTNFELGLKGRYWNNRAGYQLAIFRQLYQDFQYQADNIPVDTNGNGTNIGPSGAPEAFNAVVNASKVISTGIEIESNVLLNENWMLFYSLSYVDVEFDKFDDAPCDAQPGTVDTFSPGETYNTCDLSGQRATEAPNFSSVVSTEYSLPLKDWGADWYFRVLAKHESSRFNRGADVVLDDYTTVDAFTGVRSHNGAWDVMLWVKNATDETVVESIDFSPTGSSALIVNNPLTAGVTATWNFGLDK